jgi:hypothetical protein
MSWQRTQNAESRTLLKIFFRGIDEYVGLSPVEEGCIR